MTRLAMVALRKELADVVAKVAYGKTPIIIQRAGKDMAALVSMEDLALLEELEDRYLTKVADAADAAPDAHVLTAWDDAKREIGW